MTDPVITNLKNWIEIRRKLLEAARSTYKASLYHDGWWDALAAIEEIIEADQH